MLSSEWREARLGDLLTFRKGAGYKGSDLEDLDAPDRLLSITAIRPRGGFNAQGLRPFSGRYGQQHACEAGEIVVALTDLTQDGSMLGSPALVPAADATLVASHHVGRICELSPELCGVWLYFRLQAPDWPLRAAAWATGTTVRQVRPEALESWTIDIPPLCEQQRIGRVLAAIDRKATANSELRGSLLAHADALYQHAAAGAADRVPLGDFAVRHKTTVRPAQAPDELFEHFSIPAFDAGTLSSIDEGRALLSGKFTLPDSAVAVSKLNPETKRVLRAVRRTEHPAVCSSEFVVLVAKEGISPALLGAMVAFDRDFYDEVLAGVTGTTTSRQRVSPDDVLGATVPAFDAGTRQRLNEQLSALEQLSSHVHVERARLNELRDHLLPRFVRGRALLSRSSASLN